MAELEKVSLENEGESTEAEAATTENKELAVIDPIYQKYVKSVLRTLGSTKFYKYFMDSISRAENTIQFSNRRVEKIVDITWVEAIENSLKGFQHIISSPRNIIREDEIIVNVANAKKAGSDVVQHLAMHASLVEDFNEETGDVRPSRLMQKYREDSIGRLYENRVAFTVLEHAHQFVTHRYEALCEVMGDEFGAKLKVNSDMLTATEAVHMDTFIHIKDIESALETDEKNGDVFNRIARLQRVLTSYMSSHFARHMAKLARVKGQLTKTNMLKKDPNYHSVSVLWDFFRKYDEIGYTIKIIEQNPVISEEFERDIYHNILFNYLVLKGHLERDKDRLLPEPLKQKKRKIKPKFIKEIIEEITEDYDLPEIEIRKVLIEELTKEQLMLEEEAERRRLVEEAEQRRREEEERIRREKEAEEERRRQAEEAEKERIRLEKEAERERLERERMERQLHERMRSRQFIAEIEYFNSHFSENLEEREELAKNKSEETQDFEDAVSVLEETERLKKEEKERERQRKREEKERLEREARLAKEKAEREEAERLERERIAQEERDREVSAVYLELLEGFDLMIEAALKARADKAEQEKIEEEQREQERQKRIEARAAASSTQAKAKSKVKAKSEEKTKPEEKVKPKANNKKK